MSSTIANYASSLREVNWTMLAFRILLFVNKVIEVAVSGGKKVTKGLIEYTRPNEWVFYHGSTMPVPGWKFQEGGIGSADVLWRFCPDTLGFYHQPDDFSDRPLNLLSAEIKFAAVKASLYSLDDFIERARYSGPEAPSPSVLVNSWSIVSGVVLSNTIGLTLAVIDGEGNEVSYPIDSTVAIGSPAPSRVHVITSATATKEPTINEPIVIRSRIDLQRFFSDCSGVTPSTEKVNETMYRSVDSIGDSRIETTLTKTLAPPVGFNETEKSLDELANTEPETLDLEKVD